MRKQKGFTLIELLVVIAIIGILSSVVVASLNTARKKARDARRVDDIKQLQLALDLYFDSSGKYPALLSALAPTFIPSVPVPPSPGDTEYKYAPLSSCASYHLGITLEDPNHIAFSSDNDDTAGTAATGCPGGTAGSDFSGVDPVYAVKP